MNGGNVGIVKWRAKMLLERGRKVSSHKKTLLFSLKRGILSYPN